MIPADPKRVRLDHEKEAAYWCEVLGCTVTELREAVETVGPLAIDVTNWLAAQRRAERR